MTEENVYNERLLQYININYLREYEFFVFKMRAINIIRKQAISYDKEICYGAAHDFLLDIALNSTSLQ